MYRLTKIITYILIITLSISCGIREPQDPEKVYSDLDSAKSIVEKVEIFDLFKETNPESPEIKSMVRLLVREIRNEKGIEEAADFLIKNENFASSASFNSVAWQLYESNQNLDLASLLSEKGTAIARNEYQNHSETKPENMTSDDWQQSRKQSLAMILDTYASIEREKGNSDSAIKLFEEAVDLTNGDFAEINENYVSENMKSMIKNVFTELNGSEEGFDQYIKEFDEKARQKMVERLKNEIESRPAEDFTLVDLEGENVKLSDFKGQTVVVDFWATWCRPCLESFPGMKKAIEKLAKEKNVKFLFVNTWERVENKKENAAEFIKKNDYPFHVLLDEENKVVEKYKVQGIPTKFIIDKNQNIRFESIGFRGKTDELVEELSLMVSMIK